MGKKAKAKAIARSKAPNPLQQFLTPEAMLTPGIAGSLTMMITNALAINFSMPRAWLGLTLSFIFGLLVLVGSKSFLQKAVFYILNSLVIFCVAVGANGIGQNAGPPARPGPVSSIFGVSAAYAQTASTSSSKKIDQCSNIATTIAQAQKSGASDEKIVELVKPCQDLSRTIKEEDFLKAGTDTPKSSTKFFVPWKF